jgi:hypothetical protein
MTISDTQRQILADAAQHEAQLAFSPSGLPAAARHAVFRSMIKHGLLAEIPAPLEYIGGGWRQDEAGAWIAPRITDAGLHAIGADGDAAAVVPSIGITPILPHGESPAAAASGPVGNGDEAAEATGAASTGQRAASARPSLRSAAQALLATWDANDGLGLAAAMDALRSALPMRTMAPRATGLRQPRQGTKQQQVLVLLRQPEGASGPQLVEATGWAPHTVRGFLAGLARKGITIEVLERVRQIGPNKTGAKGSYSIYRIAEVG